MNNCDIYDIYHGSFEKKIKSFNLNYLEGGEHSFGIGIYFTKNKECLKYYSESEDYKGNIYIAKLNCLDSEIKNFNDTLTEQELNSLIKEFNLILTEQEFNDCLNIKMEQIHFYILKNFLLINNRCLFTNKQFIKKFVKATKIKAFKKEALYMDYIRTDFCVMNLKSITLIKAIDLNYENP